MKIGLFFGSFNPVHCGHMVIAGFMSEFTDLDQVWFIVSPHNPLKVKNTLLQDYHRLTLVKTAIGINRKLKASDIEKKWFIVDATDKTLGRLASQVAYVLRGKHKPTFTPHLCMGDQVIVINAASARMRHP